uniref:Uncharacterized protein n=1 Tax=Oryza sativa subsp. japonica TaxID=39947 RepID=Q69S45_ORYSJ|nr:hypothetical protein [Oryza sativa Japonica Group]
MRRARDRAFVRACARARACAAVANPVTRASERAVASIRCGNFNYHQSNPAACAAARRHLGCPAVRSARHAADYSIPLAGVHQRSGEQVSGTSVFDVLHREKAAIRFLGSASRDCSLFVRDGSPSSSLACFVPS